MLQRIYGPKVEQDTWRIRSNQELRKLYDGLDTVVEINKRRLEWTG
jgi:hypothetical protein